MRETMRSVRIGCAAVIGALVTLMVLYPGFMSIDSAVALSEGRTWSFSDLHPPVLALIWRYVDVVVPGPFGMLAVQIAVFYSCWLIVSAVAAAAWLGLRARSEVGTTSSTASQEDERLVSTARLAPATRADTISQCEYR